jgi:hypothetical protein
MSLLRHPHAFGDCNIHTDQYAYSNADVYPHFYTDLYTDRYTYDAVHTDADPSSDSDRPR